MYEEIGFSSEMYPVDWICDCDTDRAKGRAQNGRNNIPKRRLHASIKHLFSFIMIKSQQC